MGFEDDVKDVVAVMCRKNYGGLESFKNIGVRAVNGMQVIEAQ